MRICYCEQCGVRIAEQEIASGAAVEFAPDSFRCPKCATPAAPQRPPSGTHAPPKPGKTSLYKAAAVTAPAVKSVSKTHVRAVAPAQPAASAGTKWVMIGGGVLAFAGILLVAAAGRGKPASSPPNSSAIANAGSATPGSSGGTSDSGPPAGGSSTARPPADTPAEGQGGLLSTLRPSSANNPGAGRADDSSPRDALATRELAEIKSYAREHPDDPWEYRELLTDFVSRWRTTNSGKEAARLLDELKPPAGRRSERPVARWKFDESTGSTAADSAGTNSGSLKGQAGHVPGKVGPGAVSFGGNPDDYVDIGAHPSLNFGIGQAFTITGWVKTNASFGAIVSFRNSGQDGPVVDIAVGSDGAVDSPGNLVALVRQDGGVRGNAHLTGGQINTGTWRHFALARNKDGSIRLYLDGAAQGFQPCSDSGGSITTDIRAIGAERLWVGDNKAGKFQRPQEKCCLVGEVDDVRVYRCALTEAEVREIVNEK